MKRNIFPALIILVISAASCKQETVFVQVESSHSGIHFDNHIIETDSVNILDFENVYNGGGVGIGDFNNDGLQDIYFTGNQVANKLYLNKGDMKFEDVTIAAGVDGKGRWSRGVSVVDINNDGLMDLYVSCTILRKGKDRENLLYINKGNDASGVPVFAEMGAAYGLNDSTHTTMAQFFDYDNDGDLDVYLTINEIPKGYYPNQFRKVMKDGTFPSTGRLYRNDYSDSLHHGVYTNVSKQAGITIEGYGHAATVADINLDGWKDIYVTNDYLSSNILYINNRNGTFSDQSTNYFKHTSANAMGNDIQDINNDGLADVVELDMDPEDNYRKKMMLNPNSYQTYQNLDRFEYQYQYVRNTLQLNQGFRVNANDSIGAPIFSETAYLSGIAETDWSWTPLVADFDNDGYRDIIVTNGFPKDVTDHDFVAFRNTSSFVATRKQLLAQIPEVKLVNYVFHNNGNCTFSHTSKEWGINNPSFSNGAAYADLDNDGDLDCVVNNINDEAFIYQNQSATQKGGRNYLHFNFRGGATNVNGLGAFAELHYDGGKVQAFENTPYRGYLSTQQAGAFFGLDSVDVVDSVIIKWPDGKEQLLQNVKTGQTLAVKYSDAHESYNWQQSILASHTLVKEISDSIKAGFVSAEEDYIDFNIQKLLPHKLSQYGPALAVGDINRDGLEDMVLGGYYGHSAQLIVQNRDGRFSSRVLIDGANRDNKQKHDMGVLLFDADNDNDLDLYIASGGNEVADSTASYRDCFYVNNGLGNFKEDTLAFPVNLVSKSCVRAADFDKDGDLDLFVAGRCVPWKYPKAASSFLFRNDSRNGVIHFTDVTPEIAPALTNAGMVCDALFSDFDNDGNTDLILAGEFMPVEFLRNEKGKFNRLHVATDSSVGLWNSLAAADFDNDGDIDYVAGNQGQNSFYRPTNAYPVKVYGKDFDNNGNFDALTSLFLPAQDGSMKEFPAQTRDDLIKQMVVFRRRFENYKTFATTTFDKMLTPDEMKGALVLQATTCNSSYIRNDGNGKFTMTALPMQAQISSLFGIAPEDVDGDGNIDLVINGNDYGTEVSVGRYDALNGLVLLGDGKGNFNPLSILQSGLFIPGNGKALAMISNASNQPMVVATQNRGPMKVFMIKNSTKAVPVTANETYAMVHLKNGKTRKQELYFGNGFLSQSGRFIGINNAVQSAEIYTSAGNKRTAQ